MAEFVTLKYLQFLELLAQNMVAAHVRRDRVDSEVPTSDTPEAASAVTLTPRKITMTEADAANASTIEDYGASTTISSPRILTDPEHLSRRSDIRFGILLDISDSASSEVANDRVCCTFNEINDTGAFEALIERKMVPYDV